MEDKPVPVSAEEMQRLREDAQANVPVAEKALQGDAESLAEWRRSQVPSSEK